MRGDFAGKEPLPVSTAQISVDINHSARSIWRTPHPGLLCLYWPAARHAHLRPVSQLRYSQSDTIDLQSWEARRGRTSACHVPDVCGLRGDFEVA